jgi:PKD repeat protein
MKKYLLLVFLMLISVLPALSQIGILPFDGPVKSCGKKAERYKITAPLPNATYHWSASPGAVLSATVGDSITVSFPSTSLPAGDTAWVFVQQFNSNGSEGPNGYKGITILPPPQPYLTTNTRVGCERLFDPEDPKEDPRDEEPLFIPEGKCIKACEYSSVVYTAHGQAGSTFSWSVTGGTGFPSGSNITVNWGSVGQGTVTVTETNINGCTGRYTICVDIIPKPRAAFGVMPNVDERDVTVCLNQPVIFVDMSSAGNGSPIENWYWDFGDKTSYSSSTTSNPVHTYSVPGDYTVTLTVKNACNCTDTYEITIHVMNEQGVTIVCPSLVCEGDRANYSLEGKISCKDYNWQVIGGSYNNNGASIDVVWDQVDDDGFGYVTFDPSSCDIPCPSITTVKIPVIKREGRIKGQTLVCTNNSYVYRLPAWPGTTFIWSVTGSSSGNIPVLHTDQPNELVINTTVPETITIQCRYNSELVDCEGRAVITVEVMSPADIYAPVTQTCQYSTVQYTLSGNYSGNWQWVVKGPNNSTQYYDGPSNNPFDLNANLAGNYTVSVSTADFCAPAALTLMVQAAPALANAITGPAQVCAGVINEYSAGAAQAGTTFTWSVTQGTGTIQGSNTGQTIGVVFTGTGPWQLSVTRTSLQSPNCSSAPLNFNIAPIQVPLNITGSNVACPNSLVNYSVGYLLGETYEWSVVPQTAGSVKSGNNSPNITVLWNNYSGATPHLRLVVRKCNQLYAQDFDVNIVGLPSLSLSYNNEVCRDDLAAITLNSTTNVTTASLLWDFGDGTTATGTMTGTAATVTHSYIAQNTSNVAYNFSVTVTNLNGCNIDPLTINGTITVKPAPIVQITPGGQISFCNTPITQAFTASLQSGFGNTTSLIWHTPAGTVTCSSINTPPCNPYTGTTAGVYFVEAVNDNGCIAKSNEAVLAAGCITPCEFNPQPSVQITGSTTDCGHVTVTASYQSGGINPGWSVISPAVWNVNPVNITASAGGGTASFSGDFVKPGHYTIVFGASYPDIHNNLCPAGAAQDVLIPLLPKMVYQANCTNVKLTDQSLYEPGTVFDHYVFYVYDNSNNLLYTQSVTAPINNYTFSLAPNATYKVKMVVYYSHSGYNGGAITSCETGLQTLTLDPMPSAGFTFDGQNRCEKVPVYFTNTSTPSTGLSYHWDFDDQASSLVKDPARVFNSFNSGQPYNVTLTVKNQNGCINAVTHQVNITQNQLSGSISAVPQVLCEGSTGLLQFNNGGLGSPSIYKWMNNASWFNTTTPPAASIPVSSSGYYWVRVEDANQCYFNANIPAVNVSVVRLMLPVINGPASVCQNQPFTLSTYAGDPLQVWYEWFMSDNGGPFYSIAGGAGFDHPSGLAAGNYSYYVIAYTPNPAGGFCSRQSATFNLTVNTPPGLPVISFTMNNCDNYELQLSASANSAGYYNWSNGMSGSDITVNQGGYYKVWFSAGGNGCMSEAEVSIPKDPKGYLWVLPEGCYSRCIPENGITISGPIIPFSYWEWNLNTNPYITGSNSVPQPLLIYAAGHYGLLLNNGLCTAATTGTLNLTVPDDCSKEVSCILEWGEPQATQLDDCTWEFSVDIYNVNSLPLPFTITSDVGGMLTPLVGVLQPGSNTLNFQWHAPTGNGPASFIIRFWLPNGEACEREFYKLDYNCERKEGRSVKPSAPVAPSAMAAQPSAKSLFTLVPNPANTITTIAYSLPENTLGTKTLELYDITGKRIGLHNLQQKGLLQLDISARPSGIYLVVIRQNGAILGSAKLVVTR